MKIFYFHFVVEVTFNLRTLATDIKYFNVEKYISSLNAECKTLYNHKTLFLHFAYSNKEK